MLGGFLNAYILYPFLERYEKRNIRSKIETIKTDAARPFAERMTARRKDLAAILRLAGTSVPYYRDLFQKIRFDCDRVVTDPSCLEEIPFLTKEIIREEGDRMINENFCKGSLHVRKTGASTGPSTLIYYSPEDLDWTAAVNLSVLEWTGKKRYFREVHLSSRFPEAFPLKDRVKERIKCLAMNRVNIVTDSFSSDSLEMVWKKLRQVKPFLIQGHPSTLYALAMYCRKRDEKTEGVIQVFESTGEVLDRKKRDVIEKTFQCRVFDRYGLAEFGVIAHETHPDGKYQKVVDFLVWPETRPSEGIGREIVLTGLRNHAMPLIRYCTGDLGELETTDEGFLLKGISGRVHDLVPIGDRKYPTHYIQDLLDRIGGVEEFQVQVQPDGPLLLRIVPSNPQVVESIRRRVTGWWGNQVQIQFTDFNGLKRVGWREKFRYLVQ